MFCKIVGNAFSGRLHCILAGPPVGGAHITVLFKELQGVNDPQCFVNISAEW